MNCGHVTILLHCQIGELKDNAVYYDTGEMINILDRVRLSADLMGIVVAIIDESIYAKHFSSQEWAYLEVGLLVETVEAGVIYYPEIGPEIVLLSRY